MQKKKNGSGGTYLTESSGKTDGSDGSTDVEVVVVGRRQRHGRRRSTRIRTATQRIKTAAREVVHQQSVPSEVLHVLREGLLWREREIHANVLTACCVPRFFLEEINIHLVYI